MKSDNRAYKEISQETHRVINRLQEIVTELNGYVELIQDYSKSREEPDSDDE